MNTTELRFASNRVRDIERYFLDTLEGLYPEGEVRMFVRMLFEAFLGWSHAELLSRRDETVNQSDLLRFHWAAEDLKRFRPIQHIVGSCEFCGCRIEVDETTLIPRPETEEMVTRIIDHFSDKAPRRIVDLCTGSGCIAIALAKQWPEAEVWGVDVSEPALQKARKNAAGNHVKVQFLQADILKEAAWREKLPYPVDLIVSNPPYVMEQEKRVMQRNVLDWEPAEALFVPDNDALVFYHAIADTAAACLSKEGNVVVEINEQLGDETLTVFRDLRFTGNIEKDFRGNARMAWIKR